MHSLNEPNQPREQTLALLFTFNGHRPHGPKLSDLPPSS